MPHHPIIAEALKRVKYSHPTDVEIRSKELCAECDKLEAELASLPEEERSRRYDEIYGFEGRRVIIR